jgi:hypothetical protein
MGNALTNLTPGASYVSLVTLEGGSLTSTATIVGDGSGNNSPLRLGTSDVTITGGNFNLHGSPCTANGNQLSTLNRSVDYGVVEANKALVATSSRRIDFSGARLDRAKLRDTRHEFYNHGLVLSSAQVQAESGAYHYMKFTGTPVALTFNTNTASGTAQEFKLIIRQDSVGGRDVTWPSTIKWYGDFAPNLTSVAGKENMFNFTTVDGGVSWRGYEVGRISQTLETYYPATVQTGTATPPRTTAIGNRSALAFDRATDQTCYFPIIAPVNFANANLQARLLWTNASGTSGNVRWRIAVERLAASESLFVDGFAGDQAVLASYAPTPAESGRCMYSAITLSPSSGADNITNGEFGRLRITRDADHADDNMNAEALLLAVELREV